MKNSNHITISAIAAIGNQRQIGKGNELLWNLPEDLKRFKKLTKGKAVIMGRKTWESLPEAVRPLPGRENIVLTRNGSYEAPGGIVLHNLDAAISYAKGWSVENGQNEIYIIGGARVYVQALPKTEKLYLTLVDSNKDGDAFFPEYKTQYSEVERTEKDRSNPTYSFVELVKK